MEMPGAHRFRGETHRPVIDSTVIDSFSIEFHITGCDGMLGLVSD